MMPMQPAPNLADETHRNVLVGTLHDRFIFDRRARVLADHLVGLIPSGSRVLDVGCGDGTIDYLINQRRPDLSIEGIDPLIRPKARIPVRWFDGATIPYPDRSFDVVMFVDVLHHTSDPLVLLSEAARVGGLVLIKDHFREGILANTTLRLMDWVGNARHGVALPYNYWPKSKWMATLDHFGLRPNELKVKLSLYAVPLSWFFDRRLHFIARCERAHS
jgi:SAM-dependent methyltransferase